MLKTFMLTRRARVIILYANNYRHDLFNTTIVFCTGNDSLIIINNRLLGVIDCVINLYTKATIMNVLHLISVSKVQCLTHSQFTVFRHPYPTLQPGC